MIPRSVLFRCISSPIYEAKRPSQALCCPMGLVGYSPSLSPGLQVIGTYCPRSCIFYKLRQDSQHSCSSVCRSLYKSGLRFVWPVNSCTAALSLSLHMARNLLGLLGRWYFISILDCWQLVQAIHLA